MTTATLTYSGTLVTTSCWCGIAHAVPRELYQAAEANHQIGVYCPLGHSWVFKGEDEATKYKRLYREAQDQASSVRAERDQLEASRRAWKGQVTKLRKQVIEGECPLCGQHLRDLARHIGRVHPEATVEVPEAEATA